MMLSARLFGEKVAVGYFLCGFLCVCGALCRAEDWSSRFRVIQVRLIIICLPVLT